MISIVFYEIALLLWVLLLLLLEVENDFKFTKNMITYII